MDLHSKHTPPSEKPEKPPEDGAISSAVNKTRNLVGQTMAEDTSKAEQGLHRVTVSISPHLQSLVAQSAAKAGISPKDFTEQAIHSFLEDMTQKSNTPAWNYIHTLGMKQLQKSILQRIKNSEPYTSGTEGDIYRLEIDGKNYIIVKKRYHVSQKEHVFQEKAYKIAHELSEKSGNMVAVPEVFSHFVDDSSEYIVMEYVQGKTLYVVILEQMITKIILPLMEKSGTKPLNSIYLARLQELLAHYNLQGKQMNIDFSSSFYSRFEQSSRVHFLNDTEAELGTIELYNLLYEMGIIDENPNQKDEKMGSNPFLTKEYKKHFSELGIFQEGESKEIRKNLNGFLQELHKNNLYHRDLGGNPRNIMFGENGKVYIIDFGKGVEVSGVSSTAEEIYHDNLYNGRYDDDISILAMLDELTESSLSLETHKQKEKLLTLENNLPREKILMVSQHFSLPEELMLQVSHLSHGMSLNGIVSIIERSLVSNDKVIPNEFIYYPQILMGKSVSIRMKQEYINATNKGGAKFLVNLFLLSTEERENLRKFLEKKRQENTKNKKKLLYITMFSSILGEVMNIQK